MSMLCIATWAIFVRGIFYPSAEKLLFDIGAVARLLQLCHLLVLWHCPMSASNKCATGGAVHVNALHCNLTNIPQVWCRSSR
jgi:hypothetical protein